MTLSTSYRLKLTDICCRMITTDGVPVTLDERIWMNKLIEHNVTARNIAEALGINFCKKILSNQHISGINISSQRKLHLRRSKML